MVTTELTESSTSRFAQLGNIRVHYNEAGAGPALIMLHGGGPGASGWSNFHQNLHALHDRFHILLVDQLGFGQTDYVEPTEPYTQQSARTVRDLLDSLKIEKANFIGNSLGGAVSLNFAIDYPERIDHLVVMGAPGSGSSLFYPQPSEGVKKLMSAVGRDLTKQDIRDFIEIMVYDASFLTDELCEQRLASAKKTHSPDRSVIADMFKPTTPQRDLSRELGKVRAKTLVTWGSDDRFLSIDQGLTFMRGIKGSQMHIFAQCGHWAQFERAADFNSVVEAFFNT